MPRDLDVPLERELSTTVRLRVENFDRMTRIVGKESESARADLLGVDRRTVYRARHGVIGQEFIAKTISALRGHEELLMKTCGLEPTFENLFEIVVDEAAVA